VDTPPRRPGVYALLVRAEEDAAMAVGALGILALKTGYYVYLGSARGPGGLAARVGRHLSARKGVRWHIDYILAAPHVRVIAVVYAETREPECVLTKPLEARGFTHPRPGLGASDCTWGCISHFLACPAGSPAACLGELVSGFRDAGLEPRLLLVEAEP